MTIDRSLYEQRPELPPMPTEYVLMVVPEMNRVPDNFLDFEYTQPGSRLVLVTDYFDRAPTEYSVIRVPRIRNLAEAFNDGLRAITYEETAVHRSTIWDVTLATGESYLSRARRDVLRDHMRMTDTGMAHESDGRSTGNRSYVVSDEVRPGERAPSLFVVAGENGLLFDPNYHDFQKSWADYYRRTKSIHGSVEVSRRTLRNVL